MDNEATPTDTPSPATANTEAATPPAVATAGRPWTLVEKMIAWLVILVAVIAIAAVTTAVASIIQANNSREVCQSVAATDWIDDPCM